MVAVFSVKQEIVVDRHSNRSERTGEGSRQSSSPGSLADWSVLLSLRTKRDALRLELGDCAVDPPVSHFSTTFLHLNTSYLFLYNYKMCTLCSLVISGQRFRCGAVLLYRTKACLVNSAMRHSLVLTIGSQ